MKSRFTLTLIAVSLLSCAGAQTTTPCYHADTNACSGSYSYNPVFASSYYLNQVFFAEDIQIGNLDPQTDACVQACQIEYYDDLSSCELLDDQQVEGYLNPRAVCIAASDDQYVDCVTQCVRD